MVIAVAFEIFMWKVSFDHNHLSLSYSLKEFCFLFLVVLNEVEIYKYVQFTVTTITTKTYEAEFEFFFCILSSFRSSQEWIFCGKIHKRLCLLNWSFVCPWTISYANHAFEVLRYLRKIKNPLHLILPFELMIKYKKKFLFQIWCVCCYMNTLFIITFINNRNISDELHFS